MVNTLARTLTAVTVGALSLGAIALTAESASALTLSASNCSASTVRANGTNFTACAGAFTGNDTGAGRPLETALENGTLFSSFLSSYNIVDWVEYGKSDSSGPVTASNGSAAGTWGVAAPINGPFVISFKAGNENSGGGWSAFLFDGIANVTGGTFNTLGVAVNPNNGRGRGLSHASVFVPVLGQQPPQAVPEPMTILGTGAAIGLGALMKRRKQEQNDDSDA